MVFEYTRADACDIPAAPLNCLSSMICIFTVPPWAIFCVFTAWIEFW